MSDAKSKTYQTYNWNVKPKSYGLECEVEAFMAANVVKGEPITITHDDRFHSGTRYISGIVQDDNTAILTHEATLYHFSANPELRWKKMEPVTVGPFTVGWSGGNNYGLYAGGSSTVRLANDLPSDQ